MASAACSPYFDQSRPPRETDLLLFFLVPVEKKNRSEVTRTLLVWVPLLLTIMTGVGGLLPPPPPHCHRGRGDVTRHLQDKKSFKGNESQVI